MTWWRRRRTGWLPRVLMFGLQIAQKGAPPASEQILALSGQGRLNPITSPIPRVQPPDC